MKPTRWGWTQAGHYQISIYKADLGSRLDGVTEYYKKARICKIFLNNRLKGCLLQQTLIHEYIHVLEFLFKKELQEKPDKTCSMHALIFGRYLAEMITSFTYIND